MRYILIILVFLSVGANAQMVIKAHANYRPFISGNLLLDQYSGAEAAYSLRKLRTAYTGAAIRVRKDTTGQPEQDINFTAAGDLDTVALKSFLNARNGFVVTWYDQSGNGRNATNATALNQPRIANLGVIDRRSGDIALVFDGNDRIESNTDGFSVNNVSHYAVSSRGNDANAFRVIYSTGIVADRNGFGFYYNNNTPSGTQNNLYQQIRNGAISIQATGNYINTINTNDLIFGIGTSSTDYTYYNGGNEQTSTHTRSNVTSNGRIVIGARADQSIPPVYSQFLNGSVTEIVFWNSDQTTNRTGIQNNINNYYSIY